MQRIPIIFVIMCPMVWFPTSAVAASDGGRLRVIIETDAGGDPDDEQSMVRFLLYCNEWDVEGIIATRPQAREKENLNSRRTGLGIVQAMLNAYGECHPKLIQHDPRYPTPEYLRQRTVAGYDDCEDGVKLIVAAVDRDDPRPVWFCNWGTDRGSAVSNLRRALDRVLRERGQAGYAKFKNKLRLSSDDQFGPHTTTLDPPWVLWIDTFRPELERKRWYHRFSALTAAAGGFDVRRDVLTGHGPLGALYPTNTTHPQKEGDSMTFLYLVPTGMNDVEQPSWGSWAGRYGPREEYPGRSYYWANQRDAWQGSTGRDNTLARWAVDLQNDFKARMDWCVSDYAGANHPPVPRIQGNLRRTAIGGERIVLDARESTDPDGQGLDFRWIHYPEAGSHPATSLAMEGSDSAMASFIAPETDSPRSIHIILAVTDSGVPSLTRYRRVIVMVSPQRAVQE